VNPEYHHERLFPGLSAPLTAAQARKNKMTSFQAVQSEKQITDVVRLAREIWQEHYLPIIGREQVDYMLEKFQSEKALVEQLGESYEYYLVVHHGQNVGYVAVVPDKSGPALTLSKLYVRKSERSHGLGKKTLQFVENLSRQRGIMRLWLTVNKNNARSIAWYSRMGFRNAGSIIQDIGGGFVMDDFRLEKTITEQSPGGDSQKAEPRECR
jgi:ribosomal protein S18 acetylase RimI-like enzyme